MISDQVVLIANGMIVAEGKIRNVRDEIEEHPSQYIVRCRDRTHPAWRRCCSVRNTSPRSS